MKGRTLLVVAVAVLAVSSMPASAQNASAVASQHTTFGTGSAGEPSPTTLDNMTIRGNGGSAYVGLYSRGDPDIAYQDDSDNLKYVDSAGNVVDTGQTTIGVGGVGDIDGDGDLDIVYRDGSNNLKYVDSAGNVVDTGQQTTDPGGAGDIDGDGNLEIVYQNASNNLKYVDSAGNVVDTGLGANSVGGVGDIDGDGDVDIAYHDGSNVKYVDSAGNVVDTGQTTSGVGGVGDIDGDGDLDIVYRDTYDLKYVDSDGNVADTGQQASSPGGVGDIDGDGDLDIAYQYGTDNLKYVDDAGNVVDTGQSAASAGGIGDVDGDGVANSGTYVSAPHTGEAITTVWANLTLTNTSATVTWQEDGDGDGSWTNVSSTTVSSTQNLTQDLSGTTSDRWRVRVDVETTGPNPVAEIHDEGLLFEPASPTLSDPKPPDDMKIENATGDVSIDVSDADFQLSQGDTVTVSATDGDGTSLGSTTLTSNGTASLSYSSKAGENVIEWTATDEFGNTETFTQTFTTPSTLEVRNESDPSQIVNTSSDITATFFGEDGETVVERSSSDGTFDLSGLPADTEFIVQVDADGYRSRQTIITSLYDQQNVYLLPDSASAAQIEFVLDDKTGEFAQESSRLFIDIPIQVNNQTQYKTAFADEFGASGSLRVTLRDNTRYRLRVRNGGGDERVLGSYTTSGSDTVTLELGRLQFAVGEQPDTYNISATTLEDDNGTVEAVKFNYNDPQDLTTDINVSVQTANGTTLGQDEVSGTYGEYAFRQDINNSTAQNHTFVVVYEVTRDGETINGRLRPGLNRYPPGVPLDDGLKQLFSVGLLIIVGGLFSSTNARVGAVVTPLFAAGLWYVEWLPPGTSILAIALALGVGVVVNYGDRR